MMKSIFKMAVAAFGTMILLTACTPREESVIDMSTPEPTAGAAVEATPEAAATPQMPQATPVPTPEPARITTMYVDGGAETDRENYRFRTMTEVLRVVNSSAYRPRNEDERVTIIIEPGVYREQLQVHSPYVTFEGRTGDPEDVVITWFYGIGYVYNNVGPNGFFYHNVNWDLDETWEGHTRHEIGDSVAVVSFNGLDGTVYSNVPVPRGVLGVADRWGTTVNIHNTAHDFTARNVTFENSFNFYVTQEELDAGVRPNPLADNVMPERNVHPAGSTEVERSRYVERAAAFHTRAERVMVYNSRILGKQDTLFVDGTVFFENNLIMGGTDYIFGGATGVFYNNTLMFAGNTDSGHTGHITASSIENPNIRYGLLFLNNFVDYRLWDVQTPTPGNFGRPWRAYAQVTFYNTTVRQEGDVAAISHMGWSAMGGVRPDQARFFEFGSVNQHGEPLITVIRPVNNTRADKGTVLDEWQILEYNPRNYLAGWDPMNFGERFLTRVDAALAAADIEGFAEGFAIWPEVPEGIEFYIVEEEDAVIIYVRDADNGFGDRRVFER